VPTTLGVLGVLAGVRGVFLLIGSITVLPEASFVALSFMNLILSATPPPAVLAVLKPIPRPVIGTGPDGSRARRDVCGLMARFALMAAFGGGRAV